MQGIATDPELVEEIVKMASSGLSIAGIHDETGIPVPTVYKILKNSVVRHTNGMELEPGEQIAIIERFSGKESIDDLAREFNLPRTSVFLLLRQAGIDIRSSRSTVSERSDKYDAACTMYKNNWNVFDILVETGISSTTLYKELRRRKISLRAHSSSERDRQAQPA